MALNKSQQIESLTSLKYLDPNEMWRNPTYSEPTTNRSSVGSDHTPRQHMADYKPSNNKIENSEVKHGSNLPWTNKWSILLYTHNSLLCGTLKVVHNQTVIKTVL